MSFVRIIRSFLMHGRNMRAVYLTSIGSSVSPKDPNASMLRPAGHKGVGYASKDDLRLCTKASQKKTSGH